MSVVYVLEGLCLHFGTTPPPLLSTCEGSGPLRSRKPERPKSILVAECVGTPLQKARAV